MVDSCPSCKEPHACQFFDPDGVSCCVQSREELHETSKCRMCAENARDDGVHESDFEPQPFAARMKLPPRPTE